MRYAYDYKGYAHQVVAAAQRNVVFYESVGNDGEARKNKAIAERFQGRSISTFTYTEMYKYYVQYDFSALLVLFICIFGLMSVFVLEKETEMDTLLLTTTSGGFRTIGAKLIASFLFVSGISWWFWFADFIAFSVLFGSWDSASK
ncbi:hypothetical protein ACFOQM_14590 [Paenibacillus sp. GCM10012307]|uniref:Uncharacterized protein n=2 Tax=Paenibacillus roseus TaxID=2798579 RepID=A0A934J442_9BACL|nr:hypothetical protein [Paenibacillus roseus]